MKVLIIRLSAIGDTIHTLPAAAALKRLIPGIELTWLVEESSAPLLAGNPVVDSVLVLPKREWSCALAKPWRWPRLLKEVAGFAGRLRSARFDAALDFQGLLKSAVCAYLSGSAVRIGFAGTREGAHLLMTDKVPVGDYFGPSRHVVELNLRLVERLCRKLGVGWRDVPVEFVLPPAAEDSVRKIEHLLEHAGRQRDAVLIPGTTWTSKIWTGGNWARLGQLLSDKYGLRICLVGGDAERATNSGIIKAIADRCPGAEVLDLTGQTSLIDLVALFQRADIVVGGDTGPLHLAAAVGRPKVFGIYGSTPTGRNGPWGLNCLSISLALWCQPCFKKVCPLSTTACLNDLSPEKVFNDMQSFLES